MCLTTSFGVTEKQSEIENKEANRAEIVSQRCITWLLDACIKIQASPGFEPVTSAIPVQCSTN